MLQWKHFARSRVVLLPDLLNIKGQLIQKLDDATIITDIGLYQQCIVTSMTAMEVYLSDVFELLPKKSQTTKSRSFQNMSSVENAYKQYCDIDLFNDVKTKIDLSFLMEVRHEIIHKGGIIDQKFIDNCSGNKKYDYCSFNSKYVSDKTKFQKDTELNFLFNDKMIESVHNDVRSFIKNVHLKTNL